MIKIIKRNETGTSYLYWEVSSDLVQASELKTCPQGNNILVMYSYLIIPAPVISVLKGMPAGKKYISNM